MIIACLIRVKVRPDIEISNYINLLTIIIHVYKVNLIELTKFDPQKSTNRDDDYYFYYFTFNHTQ